MRENPKSEDAERSAPGAMSASEHIGVCFGYLGAVSCLVMSCIGAAYGSAQAGLGLCRAGCRDPNMVIKGIIPVAMAGVRGIYGLVLSIIIMSGIRTDGTYGQYNGYMHLRAGLCCGAAQFASGIAVGVVGEAGTQATVFQSKLFAPLVLILIFTEALALYGLIVGMIMAQSGQRRVDG